MEKNATPRRRKNQPLIPARHKTLWTKEDRTKLIALLEHGHGYHYIAHRMKRSHYSVIEATRKKLKTSVGDMKGRGAYSPFWLCENYFTGKDHKWIIALIKHSYLKAYQTYAAPHAHLVNTYRVSEEELHRFLDNPDYFMLWQPDNLQDEYCKRFCQQIRDDLGWKWLTTQQVATELGYGHSMTHIFLTTGEINGVPLESVKRFGKGGGSRWVKSCDVENVKRVLNIGLK